MEARLNVMRNPVAGKFITHILGANKVLTESGLSATTRELVALRVSQINGCAGCIDMHTKEAEAAGETAVRLHLVAAWREATVYTAAERAALDLAEHATRIADGYGVPDEVWEAAAAHFDEDQLVALVCHISMMNAFNRLNVTTRQPAGDYVAGRLPH
ncbi:AhpD family alkylhydroperoxidase [Stackebrandtia albiflava]|uniref:AhpD family alkylhydroperoxidase n=1 Tax=Stackebrandtia albiflava TaxID=406432 RepID=A0A562V214_9ACTN|nr:carboxymuconolactone decarboxylase family protein [Stackebrandtia albiflava]TWJ11847.1 AhpD family alkylhydroperoxidase [Stackebrandtia albiflava]